MNEELNYEEIAHLFYISFLRRYPEADTDRGKEISKIEKRMYKNAELH